MASADLSTIIDPRVFAAYTQELSTNLSLLIKSGVVTTNAALDSFVAGGGSFVDLPFWNDLADTEANSSTSQLQGVSDATPEGISTGRQTARRFNRNQNWGAADLAGQIAGDDPLTAVASLVAGYWNRQDQLMINNTIAGLVLLLPEGNANAIENKIALTGGGTPGVPNKFNAAALLDTFQLLGDHKASIAAIAVHSVVQTEMQKASLIDYRSDNDANIGFGTYMGKSLIVDDNLYTADDSGNVNYSTVCYGQGAFLMGTGSPRVPAEVTRYALAGVGGGEEVLTSRREFVLHPAGFQMGSVLIGLATGISASNTNLNNVAAYALAVDRKRVPLAVLNSNG